MKTMKKYILFGLTGVLMTSCLDTTVLPEDVIIGEDYWQNKGQVSQMVANAYQGMCSTDLMERCIIWGELRSDEMNHLNSVLNVTKETEVKRMNTGNMDYQNSYAKWADFYTVINRCNIVLEKCGDVVKLDPSYDLSTCQRDSSQMLALRALCYFYLVRAYRDVPYTEEAVLNSSQQLNIEQRSPQYVLDRCIKNLEKALEHPLSPTSYTDWRKNGLMNSDAIKALLADIYLWRASMFPDGGDYSKAADYQKVVQYCDEVIKSKQDQNSNATSTGGFGGPGAGGPGTSTSSANPYFLIDGESAYNQIFIQGNSKESLFELQMDGNTGNNYGLYYCYYNISRNMGLMKAAVKFAGLVKNDWISTANVFNTELDYRYWEACCDVKADGTTDKVELSILKMVNRKDLNNSSSSRSGMTSGAIFPGTSINRSSNTTYRQNWIVYRLTDVLLMKAEALVQLDDPAKFAEAYDLVCEVNNRSMAKTDDAMPATSPYTTKDEYEKLVLAERQRELCFEGKRWFDLMRYNYRHVTGIQPDKMLSEIGTKKTDFVSNNADFNAILANKYIEGGTAIVAKMNNEAFLYLPIPYADMQVSGANVGGYLHQNPAYVIIDQYSSNNGK